MAGSYYIEYLTSELIIRSRELIEKIDSLGGSVKALEAGFIQEQIAASAYEFQKKVETKQEIIVGVNEFVEAESEEPVTLKIDPNLERDQIERVKALRNKRDEQKTMTAITEVERAAAEGTNLMPHILNAIESYATLGEIADAMRRVFGEYAG